MKKIIAVFGALFLLLCGAAFALPSIPFTVYGQVINDSTPVSGVSVTVTNEDTGEFLTEITDAEGWYVVNLGNMPGGSNEGDSIKVDANISDYDGNTTAARVQDSPQRIDVALSFATPPEPPVYLIDIIDIKILNSSMDETTTIIPGASYYVQIRNNNPGEDPVESLQLIMVSEGSEAPLIPLNLGSVKSTINAGETSEITVGFQLPGSATSGTAYTVNAFNWNDWASLPGGGTALSEPLSATFHAA